MLFDFFRQRYEYDRAKLNYERAQQIYQENIRNERINLINVYFQTKIAQVKSEGAERSFTIAQAISELVNSRKALGKSTAEEVSSAMVDLNNAKIEYVYKKRDHEQKLLTLNYLLNSSPETAYQLTTEIPFLSVRLDDQELFEIFKKMSPTSRNQNVLMSLAAMDAALAEKNRLPLPKISLQMLNMTFDNNFSGGTGPAYQYGQNPNRGAVDVSALITLTLPIYGPSGFFSERTVRQQYINREVAEIDQHLTMMNNEIIIKQQIINIRNLEKNIITQKETYEQNQKLLNSYFKKVSSGVDRLQLRDAIFQARESQFQYFENLLGHLSAKYELAKMIGLDRLPGDLL